MSVIRNWDYEPDKCHCWA